MAERDEPPLDSLHDSIRAELIAGESLVWWGRPRPRAQLRGFAIWIFAVPWTAFSLGWETMAFLPWIAGGGMPDGLRIGLGLLMPLFGAPFVLVGLWMMAKPFTEISRARRTAFGLSNRRVFRVELGRLRKVTSVFIDRIGPIEVTERRDGSGDLRIQTHSTLDSEGDRTTERFDMVGVPEVARVRRLIVERQPAV